jgi:hypothetical protein
LSNTQGNHGEDVKECYYFLDNVPSHAYMKALYKYPQRAFPYQDLVETNGRRTRLEPEYELVDTGIFADDANFDITIEYAKHGPTDILARITAINRGQAAAPLHLIPQLWFRNDWVWEQGRPKPSIAPAQGDRASVAGRTPHVGSLPALLRGRSGAALHGKREQYGGAFRYAQRAAVRQGRHRPRARRR